MRFIIHELPYETPLAAGKWRYQQDGVPTGAVESWRLSLAQDGYRFLRVDLDARAAESGRSILYHLTLDPQQQPVQLRYRLWGEGPELTGTALFEEEDLILVTERDGQREEEVLALPPQVVFWFPSSAALGLLVHLPQAEALPGIRLQLAESGASTGLEAVQTTVTVAGHPPEQRVIMGDLFELQPVSILFEDQERRLWLDHSGQPLRMARQDGLTAVETQLITYEQRISGPGGNGR